ncbi:hypothetical protein FIV42_15470 [Persicimonas caeni]|uniref:Putative endonuclease Z1 domain-containing protein n=1 Tax=Persicimonas caeni TaxID=2292766 RepID=A0A4Y6PUT3_PERCE|nr:Z1 domain-containing protein [Persicimonas caeni]QDG52091.1 hypothetical protein FIV42_15470 [Persicimonas caeni]QED33312.1 hypothetical protein FRD00_15465 [Persicimonas caeni]
MTQVDKLELEEYLQDYEMWIRGGYAPEKARARLLRFVGDEAVVDKIAEEYRKRTRRFIKFTDPRVLEGQEHIETWYPGPDFDTAWCWPAYKGLLHEKGWANSAIESVDTATTKLMAYLPHPGEGDISTRGLVLGYVQSGKTANYTGLIAKAADIGYKLFIVLTGMTSSLRRQTQRRLHAELCAPNSENWNELTSATQDFQGVGNPDYMLNPRHPEGRILCVVKKNVYILDRLRKFFAQAKDDVKRGCPVVIIDDEADQASVNTRRKADERSAINQRIVQLLETLPKSVYIGYTATPFANIFIDPTLPEDLYPRDFIFDLPRPRQYFGAERIFGREMIRYDDDEASYDGLDMLRDVPEEDAVRMQPPGRNERFEFQPEMTPTLENALRYFVLASACRLARGQTNKHSSMLIHTTLYTYTHGQLQQLVAGYVREFEKEWTKYRADLSSELQTLWEQENARVTPADLQMEINEVSFDEIAEHIDEVFERCEVVVDNGQIGSGLNYNTEEAGVHIAIGGNTLSRGLTIEGLIVSYFIRTASAYDTLLQMGRWFGYRPGYEDLPRVWMTSELQDHFIHLATVEEEIRHDIRRYEKENKTPLDFAVRVQTHPKLAVTSRLKMQHVTLASASYSDSHIQTFQFKHDDREWLQSNLEVTRELLEQVSGKHQSENQAGARWLYRNVDVEPVLEFLRQYQSLHEDFENRLLINYVERELEHEGLQTWNIGIIGNQRLDSLDIGADVTTHLVTRSRFRKIQPANIKALTSRADRIIDLDWDGSLKSLNSESIKNMRNERQPDNGLLLIYPIDKDSEPANESKLRHPLDAKEHIIGIGLSFPKSKRPMRDYVKNNLDRVFEGEGLDESRPEEEDIAVSEDEQELEG